MLYQIHQKMKTIFINQPDEAINFLLLGALESRGGFKDANQFKRFFE